MGNTGNGEEIPIGQELGHHREAHEEIGAGERAVPDDAPVDVQEEEDEEIEIGNEIGRDSDRSG